LEAADTACKIDLLLSNNFVKQQFAHPCAIEREVKMALSRVLAHELDAAWIIALWKYIHGGDPPPSEQVAAAQIVAALAPVLAGGAAASASPELLRRRFGEIGSQISVERVEGAAAAEAHTEALPTTGIHWQFVEVCFGIPPNRHCVLVQLPHRVAT
jgi:hypothetical protein